ncbi:hypothetical protein GCM10022416_17760 [Actinomadura keratinilytica]|uniref:Uncharacterized protein n=1 Tax=Actinomadura keratinilytica TaxID=547461 RepID=A0ABP7YG60_9ACTN
MTSPQSDLGLPWRLHPRLPEDSGSDIQENSEQTRIYHDSLYGSRKKTKSFPGPRDTRKRHSA